MFLTSTSIERPWIFIEIGAMITLGKRVVWLTDGTEHKIAPRGIDSALGTSLRGSIDDRKRYFLELRRCVEESAVR